jgi:amino acid adenylation domain-containing protein
MHEVLVGIYLERSLDMLVAVLGILKAGAAYVPFEPGHPAERLAFMIEDSRPAVLLSRQEELAHLPPACVRRVCVDTDWEEIATSNIDCGGADAGPDSLCYVIYTSGSTGMPKAAMNTHRGVANRLQWMQSENGLDESDCVLHKTPITFDVSASEIFAPLLAGAKLVLARPGGHQDSRYLAQLVCLEGVTALHFVPSMLQVFLEGDGIETLGSLKRVVCSGEALPDRLIERHAQRMNSDLYNLYGPTEASIEVSKWRCDQGQRTSIGKPIANAQLYVLNGHQQPAPIGVPGELYIGGVPLARGYLNRPDMTAECFEPSPYREPGSRTYRTGDLARVRHDGNIEYLGRIDHQVKVRGFRIELGEVESALSLHPAVDSCAVTALEEPSGSLGLVGYIAHRGSLAVGDLRAFLEQKLPEYMIPSTFVVLDSLPLNPNGKVDRRALPPPNREIAVSRQVFVAPETDIELALASIWAEVLGIERVSVNDNFFDLGGHSLSATRVLSQVQRRFKVEIALRSFFETPSIAGLALSIEAALVKKLEVLTDAEAEVMLREMDASKDSPR